jgi:hypothetical protein
MLFRETPIQVTVGGDRLTLDVQPESASQRIRAGVLGDVRELGPGDSAQFVLSPRVPAGE